MPEPTYPIEQVKPGQTAGYVGSPGTFEAPDAGDSNTTAGAGGRPIAHLVPATATPEAIVNALIAAGLMEAS